MNTKNIKFYIINKLEFIIISILLIALVILFHETSIDNFLITPFFSKKLPNWPWRDSFIAEKVFHKGGIKFMIVLFLFMISQRFLNKRIKSNYSYKIFFSHSLLSIIISIGIIALLKERLPIQCPWYLKEFLGSRNFVSLFDIFNPKLSGVKCFPAGHASVAYAWISIYFSYQLISGKRKYLLLLPGLLLGLIYGITQQMRGAHFASHDIATLLVCWFTSGSLALLFEYFLNKENA